MNSWGILGKPTPEKIRTWMDMPYGDFKKMVTDLNKKVKGKSLRRYTVETKKIKSEYQLGYSDVEAYTPEQAIDLAKSKVPTIWTDIRNSPDKYEYRISQIWN